jgi:sugar lactone lactonase YvrE
MIPTAIQVLPSPGLRVIADGLRFPEGPVALSDGTVLVVEIAGQALTRIQPDGRKEPRSARTTGPMSATAVGGATAAKPTAGSDPQRRRPARGGLSG